LRGLLGRGVRLMLREHRDPVIKKLLSKSNSDMVRHAHSRPNVQLDRFKALRDPGKMNENTLLAQLRRHRFSKVLSILLFFSRGTRALTFENVCCAGRCPRASVWTWETLVSGGTCPTLASTALTPAGYSAIVFPHLRLSSSVALNLALVGSVRTHFTGAVWGGGEAEEAEEAEEEV
jgi:hypothetical protein